MARHKSAIQRHMLLKFRGWGGVSRGLGVSVDCVNFLTRVFHHSEGRKAMRHNWIVALTGTATALT
jgi:hypothetical protein